MRSSGRTGFFSLILLFLRRMPSVWAGGFAAALVILIGLSELGPRAAAIGALAVMAATVGAECWVDRRRGVGRRMLIRGPVVSPRRAAALLLALGLIASATMALATNFFSTMQRTAADDLRNRSAPPPRRGS